MLTIALHFRIGDVENAVCSFTLTLKKKVPLMVMSVLLTKYLGGKMNVGGEYKMHGGL
jgi:hypothetical protein